MAKKVEAKFKTLAVEKGVFDIKPKTPNIQDVWTESIKWTELNKRSWKADRSPWSLHIQSHLKGPMDKIRCNKIQGIINRMIPDYKPATIKQTLVLIKRVFNWPHEQRLYEGSNPCDGIKIPKFDHRVTNPLTPINLMIGS